ncbi:hypothetical protein [Roseitranquillus sediminis]|uniref:hypothetical protein n=1 Tax=Roseitranquillus sediminis TaxID=2809051 RepID=UPI001D0C308F|nr:hypothetical protein [Roseitranquillus sediminis]MBM9595091.1 hypothetical protein [Roseitranquillus sediminis]
MTPSPPPDVAPDQEAIAAAALASAASSLGLSEAEAARALRCTGWRDAGEMLRREFLGSYRGYYPRCGMTVRAEAVTAELFDALAIAMGDPRRAQRHGAAGTETRHG